MYTPSRAIVYQKESFPPIPGQVAQPISVDVTSHGYPPEAVAVELLLGCRSWGDGAYVVAYDGVTSALDRIAVYPTSLMRNQWALSRARVELEGSSFLLWIRPYELPVEVIAVLKGYYTVP